MDQITPPKQTNFAFPILLFCTILSGVFWLIGMNIDIYGNAIVGAVFEILWLPVILFTFLIPVASLIFWIKNRLSLKSKYLYLMLASIAILYFVVTRKA